MLWRRSVHSTSSTSLPTHSREVLDLSPLAIVDSIHSAVIAKSYRGLPNTDPSVLENFSDRLSTRVQSEVRAVSEGSHLDATVDWEVDAFRPIIATFRIQEDLGICQRDTEYVFLLSTLLILAYELLLMAGKDKAPKARSFLARSSSQCLVEPEVCYSISEMFEFERKRLAEGVAGTKVLRVIQNIRSSLPNVGFCTADWNVSVAPHENVRNSIFRRFSHMLGTHTTDSQVLRCSNEKATSRESCKTVSVALPLSRAFDSEDVKVKVFLKPGCSWSLDLVTSIVLGGGARMRTSTGLVVKLEKGYSISTTTTKPDTVVVVMPSKSADGFMATVYTRSATCTTSRRKAKHRDGPSSKHRMLCWRWVTVRILCSARFLSAVHSSKMSVNDRGSI